MSHDEVPGLPNVAAGHPSLDAVSIDAACLALWGKSATSGGRPHLLVSHMLDAAAVGEILWDRYLPAGLRDRLDSITEGHGRASVALLCGAHDVGKATPLFVSQVPELARRVVDAGLEIGTTSGRASAWHHATAGAAIIRVVGRAAGWNRDTTDWVWPLIAGHHGRFPSLGKTNHAEHPQDHGAGPWGAVQARLLGIIAKAAGFEDLRAMLFTGIPSRGDQLTLAGTIVMADWLASNQWAFEPIDDPESVAMESARERAERGWKALNLHSGWTSAILSSAEDVVHLRFGRPARGLQLAAQDVARAMPAPGVMIIEAPMGEGKTEAALAAAEILAGRFGCRGLFVGMPTQATSDPMFTRVREWSRPVAKDVPIALLHGKRLFNREWRDLADRVHIAHVDEDGRSSVSDAASGQGDVQSVVSDWFLGRKRGLLAPFAIGTIDNLLLAGTRTPHVMLRHTGLAGKVVVLDEIHAASVYMAQFLTEVLRWLGSARVPVILLTATLPPALRDQLVVAHLEGGLAASGHEDPVASASASLAEAPPLDYPSVLGATVQDGRVTWSAQSSEPWRPSRPVTIESIPSFGPDGREIADLLTRELADGGCALVIRNTVASAQATYLSIAERFGEGEVELLHARLLAGERGRRTDQELNMLGPDAGPRRPWRHILVATQVAEQSFDVDVDILVTDLAPIDLLLQRVGRVHRHQRSDRPSRLVTPRVIVTGWRPDRHGPPEFPSGSRAIYRDHRLLRTAARVQAAIGGSWDIPREVPSLVAAVYGSESLVPPAWMLAAERAADEERAYERQLVAAAGQGLLGGVGEISLQTLAGLHERGGKALGDDDLAVAGVVREGEQAAEVVLLRLNRNGDQVTLGGRPLTSGGRLTTRDDAIEEAVASLVRLPAQDEVTRAALELDTPRAWRDDPLLCRQRALVVDDDRRGTLGGTPFQYHERLGLVWGSRGNVGGDFERR